MELSANTLEQVIQATRQYGRLKAAFTGFIERAAFLATPRSPIQGVRLAASPESDFLDVFVAGIQLRFQFFLCYAKDRSVRGSIVCLREVPYFSETRDIVGSFTFSGHGITDIEVKEGEDKPELDYHAIHIIAYFVDKAIAAQPFLPSV